MSIKTPQGDAKVFVERYHSACEQMGESKNDVIKYFDISKAHLDEIFSKAASNGTPCEIVRIYLGKKTAYDTNLKNPKFSIKDDYNLIIVGADNKGVNIISTAEIYDHLLAVAGEPNLNDF